MAHRKCVTFLSDGTFTAEVTGVHTFFTIGGGGGGKTDTGGGGGGGASWAVQAMTASETAAIVVGQGGAADTDGTDTTVTYSSTVICKAMKGLSRTNGGTGGQAADGIGSIKYSGGNGGAGIGIKHGGGAGGTQQSGLSAIGGNYFGGVAFHGTADSSQFYGAGGGSSSSQERPGKSGVVYVFYDIDVTGYPEVTDRAYSRGNSSSHAITMPICELDDLLLCLYSSDSNSSRTFTPSAGWTKLIEQANSMTEEVRGGVYYKFATASNSLTITPSSVEAFTAITYCIKNGGIPTATGAGGDSTNPDCPEHVITSAKALWIAFAAREDSTATPVTAPPTGYNDFQFLSPSVIGTSASTSVATLHYEGTTQNPGAYTADSEQWAAFTIAIPYLERGFRPQVALT